MLLRMSCWYSAVGFEISTPIFLLFPKFILSSGRPRLGATFLCYAK